MRVEVEDSENSYFKSWRRHGQEGSPACQCSVSKAFCATCLKSPEGESMDEAFMVVGYRKNKSSSIVKILFWVKEKENNFLCDSKNLQHCSPNGPLTM